MSPGQRFRMGSPRSVARFLADHQHHDQGFDIERAQGPGRPHLRITCNACGESLDYKAGEGEPEIPVAAAANNDEGVASPRPTPLVEGGRSREEVGPPLARTRARLIPRGARPWVVNGAIAALIIAGVALIGIGLRDRGDDDEGPIGGVPTNQGSPTVGGAVPESPPAQPPQRPGGVRQGVERVRLDRREVLSRFEIGVPPGWSSGQVPGGVRFASRSGDAEVTVFFEQRSGSLASLSDPTTEFLKREHRGAQVSGPVARRVGQNKALEFSAIHRGGRATATLLAEGGFTYLIYCEHDKDASRDGVRRAYAVVDSIRPIS
jgi:hypothetical protein